MIPSLILPFPFVSTYFGSSTGFGVARLELNADVDGDGVVDVETGKFGAYLQDFAFGVALAKWLGIEGRFRGVVVVGADPESAIVIGGIGRAEADGGFVFRLLRGERYSLAVHLGGSYSAGKNVSPLGVILGALETGDVNRDVILRDMTSWKIAPSLAFAFAPVEHLGVQATAGYSYGKTSVEDAETSTSKRLELGAGLSLDARGLFAPIAIPLNYRFARADGENEHEIETGLFYSGRSNLSLGGLFLTNLGSENKQYAGAIRLFYYW